MKTIYVIESAERRKKVFSFINMDWYVTPYWWIHPLWIIAGGFSFSSWLTPDRSILFSGIVFALLLEATSVAHWLGHITFSRLAETPMKGMLFTATLPVNLYDPPRVASRAHIIRASGGPTFNLALGIFSYASALLFDHNIYLLFFGILNILFGVSAMLPIPTMDGGVFLRELRNWRKE